MSSENPYKSLGNHARPDAPDQAADGLRTIQTERRQFLTEKGTKRRTLSNPRVLLPLLLVPALFLSIIWAYLDRPRLQAGFGGIGDTIAVPQDDFKEVVVRSERFCEVLEGRLKSPAFLAAVSAEDEQRPPILPPGTPVLMRRLQAPQLDANPFAGAIADGVVTAYKRRGLVFMLGESGRSDLYVMYLLPRGYAVYRPDNPWILWLQAHLPGMPDEAGLAEDAKVANQAVKDRIRTFVELAIHDCSQSTRREPPTPVAARQ